MNGPVQIDPQTAYRLAAEFGNGFRAFYDPALKFEMTREFNRRWREQRATERRYCEEFLAQLDAIEAGSADATEHVTVRVARSVVRAEMALIEDDREKVRELLQQALADAQASGQPFAIETALIGLGHFYREQDDAAEPEAFERAVWHYKEALRFCDGVQPWLRIPSLLYWLGMTLARRDETLPEAVFTLEWAARFGSAKFTSLQEMQQCRLRLGEREALLREAEPPPTAGLCEIASGVAALQALGRRRKRLAALAQRGVDLAAQLGERSWEGVFQAVLDVELQRSGG